MKLETERLILRRFRTSDTETMIGINANARVMEHFPSPMSKKQTLEHLQRVSHHWEEHGFGLFALEVQDTGQMIGFAGLSRPAYETPFTPCVEVGWRLAPDAWGKSYAFEAAQACLNWGFKDLKLSEIVSFAYIGNIRSTRLMTRLGMQHDKDDDFDHPMLPLDSPLLRHVLFRLPRTVWTGPLDLGALKGR